MSKRSTAEREQDARREEKRKRKAADSICGYTNEDNRFGDANLTKRFIWGKKIEKSRALGEPIQVWKSEHERRIETEREVLKVKQRREERERELAQLEEERQNVERSRETSGFGVFGKKEDEFHLEQTKMRAQIRIREGRAKPIDIIAKNLIDDDPTDFEMTEPHKLFRDLALDNLIELKGDIAAHADLDKTNAEFWEALAVVCDDELIMAQKREAIKNNVKGIVGSTGVNDQVQEEAEMMFQGKSHFELVVLEKEINETLATGGPVDIEFWESMIGRLKIAKAKARLGEIHRDLIRKRLKSLQAQQDDPKTSSASIDLAVSKAKSAALAASAERENDDSELTKIFEFGEGEEDEEYDRARLSPVKVELNSREVATDADEDLRNLLRARFQVLSIESEKAKQLISKTAEVSAEEDWLYRQEASKDMEEGEVQFGGEVQEKDKVYWWHDKYRPRKPRYFNRVHTGYEWNKYNSTHYDHDNPPPKIVQGYKFNIFYPDLLDKVKAPTYTILPDTTTETCIIRFTAGPPYEDISFRIVNKEWEFSHKKGFKCSFDRGILHLYFHFKRHRYRR